MTENLILWVATFGGASSLVLLLYMLFGSRQTQIDSRIAQVSRPQERRGRLASVLGVLPRLGGLLLPNSEQKLGLVTSRLRQAGFYRSHAISVFAAMRFLLLFAPIVVGVLLSAGGMIEQLDGIFYGIVVGLVGTLLPGFVINYFKKRRQQSVRRGLPDALDVVVICLEGGLSMSAAFARVAEELGAAYPLLAEEMIIVRRQIELGHTASEAFQHFADRFGLDELNSLALLIGQSERFGTSVVRTLIIQAEGLRLKRYQWAEAQAQKAPLKLIFPTVLCIFPALYIVLMGPAGVRLYQLLDTLGNKP
jgi:tight adherence protein C